ncbi:MAG: SUF system Fe-S cluster assembly regulator [Pseudomonadota bacterium]
MIRLSRLTDYGFVVLRHFASHPELAAMNARDVAQSTQLPFPTVGKLLKLLTKRGLLASHRGANGGYTLARPPERITIAEIIAALEGPIAVTECNIADGACDQESHCPTRPHWHLINAAIYDALQKIALSNMAESAQGSNGALPVWTGR